MDIAPAFLASTLGLNLVKSGLFLHIRIRWSSTHNPFMIFCMIYIQVGHWLKYVQQYRTSIKIQRLWV